MITYRICIDKNVSHLTVYAPFCAYLQATLHEEGEVDGWEGDEVWTQVKEMSPYYLRYTMLTVNFTHTVIYTLQHSIKHCNIPPLLYPLEPRPHPAGAWRHER